MLKRIEFLPADVLGLSALAAAARSGRAEELDLAVPRHWDDVAPPVALPDPSLQAHLARWIESRLTQLGPHVACLESARALAAPGASCVLCRVTPGLLGSPLASLWNALACVRAANALAKRWQKPVVPIAWVRADEEALGDIHRTWIPNRHHELQRIGLPGAAGGPLPLADAALEEEHHRLPAVRALLRQLYGDHEHIEEAVDLLVPRAGESLARAATRGLLALLGPKGLVVLEPDWLRDETARALAGFVGSAPLPRLERAAAELRARGLDAGVEPTAVAFVLHEERPHRRALRAGSEGFRYDGEPGSRTPAELAAAIVKDPTRWSAGALIAPLVAEQVLPVAAHLGGEAELPGHALRAQLHDPRGIPAVPFLLRAGVTLVDEETARSLERLGLSPAEVLARRGLALDETAAVGVPPAVAELRAIAEAAFRELLQRHAVLGSIEPSLPGQLERAASQARAAIEAVLGKAERVAADRSGRGRRHARRVQTVLAPRGEAQEQVLGPFPFLARYGSAWIEELALGWDPLGAEHLLVYLGSEDAR